MYDLLTPVAPFLAFLVLGSSVEYMPYGLILHTYSYNYKDLITLMHILIIKYRLSCTIGRIDGKPVIYILAESV